MRPLGSALLRFLALAPFLRAALAAPEPCRGSRPPSVASPRSADDSSSPTRPPRRGCIDSRSGRRAPRARATWMASAPCCSGTPGSRRSSAAASSTRSTAGSSLARRRASACTCIASRGRTPAADVHRREHARARLSGRHGRLRRRRGGRRDRARHDPVRRRRRRRPRGERWARPGHSHAGAVRHDRPRPTVSVRLDAPALLRRRRITGAGSAARWTKTTSWPGRGSERAAGRFDDRALPGRHRTRFAHPMPAPRERRGGLDRRRRTSRHGHPDRHARRPGRDHRRETLRAVRRGDRERTPSPAVRLRGARRHWQWARSRRALLHDPLRRRRDARARGA